MSAHAFVSGTGTEVGKTWVTRGVAAASRRRGLRVAALKPYETGCAPDAQDALALARAAGDERDDPAGFYRASAPLSPWAATLRGEPPPPPIDDIVKVVRARSRDADVVVVEGAGGLLVPVDETRDVADLAVALAMPLFLVARNGLGVLSHTLTAALAAESRGLDLKAVVLTLGDDADPSTRDNARILRARLKTAVLDFPRCADDDGALAEAAEACGLMDVILGE